MDAAQGAYRGVPGKVDTPPSLIYQAWRKKRFELVTSEWQLDEFRCVSRYSKLRRFLKLAEAGNLVNGLRHQATILETLPTVGLSPDPDDNLVLAMTEASQAHYLVTGDKKDLLALGTIGGTHIVTARQFIEAPSASPVFQLQCTQRLDQHGEPLPKEIYLPDGQDNRHTLC